MINEPEQSRDERNADTSGLQSTTDVTNNVDTVIPKRFSVTLGCFGVLLGLFLSAGFALTSWLSGWDIPWPFFTLPLVLVIWLLIFIAAKKHKKIIGLSLLGVIVAMGLGFGVYKIVTPVTIPASVSDVDVREYTPFTDDSKLVHLPNQASLQLTDNLPKLDGATALVPVYGAFVEAVYPSDTPIFEYLGPVQYNSTEGGYINLVDKRTDIMFGAYPSKQQLAYAEQEGETMEFTPIGREGFVFFVNQANPVQSLSSQQIKDIYSGKITNWSEVGGENVAIIAYQRNEGSGSQSMFLRFMDTQTPMVPSVTEKQGFMGGIVRNVHDYQNSRGAIGFSFRYFTQDMMQDYPVKLLEVDGVAPTLENIANDSYPLSSEFYAVTLEGNDGKNIKPLIDWILSSEGQYIIRETGYIPINP
jgi:phosphate transport system substrate-binding protein